MIGLIAKIGKHLGGVFPPEDLTTYTEVDANADLTVTAQKVTFTTYQRQYASWVVYDFGADYFGNFTIDFDAEVTYCNSIGACTLLALGNIAGSNQDFRDANVGINAGYLYGNSGNLSVAITDYDTDTSDNYLTGGLTMSKTYFRFDRIGTTLTLYLYSDAARTTLVDILVTTCAATTYRYLHVFQGREVSGTYDITGYIENVVIRKAA